MRLLLVNTLIYSVLLLFLNFSQYVRFDPFSLRIKSNELINYFLHQLLNLKMTAIWKAY